jgi:PEGA domain-containing protein
MKSLLSFFLVSLLVVAPLTAQQAPSSAPVPAPAAGPAGLTLQDGTPVRLRLGRTVSSADARVGDTVDFEVVEDVYAGNTLVVPRGGVAWATVTEAHSKRRMARGGKLTMNTDSVRLVDGEKVPLRAVKDAKGGGHVGVMTGAMAATAIVFLPAAPLFLFMHGKDITIPKGTEITAYIDGNVSLDMAKFAPQGDAPPPAQAVALPAASAASDAGQATLEISSSPPGADIEIDGNFVGNAPSSLTVAPGEHIIRVIKAGYLEWEKRITTSSGNVTIAAELEPTEPESK